MLYTLRLYDNTGTAVEATLHDAVIVGWSKKVNGPGKLVYKLPVGSPNATEARWRKFKRVKLDRRKTDGSDEDETVWYGYIDSHKRTGPGEYTVSCAGMLQLFKKRFTAKDETFTGQGSDEAFGLLTDTNGNDGDTGIVSGSGGVTSTKSAKASGKQDMLSMWEELAKAHDAEFEINDDGEFNFVDSLGEDKTAEPPLVYRNDGYPGNTVEGVEEGEDGSPMANKVIAYNSGGTITSTQQDAPSQTLYGVLIEVVVIPEANDQTTLDNMAQDILAQKKAPITDFGANPIPAGKRFNTITGDLEIEGFQYGDLMPGDLFTAEIINQTTTVEAVKRVIEMTVEVNGNKESVKLTIGDEGVFVSASSLANRETGDIKKRVLALEQGAAGTGGGGGGSSASFVDRETPSGSVNGVNTSFVLSQTPVTGSDHVFLNGTLQTAGVDYSISGTTITFVIAPLGGSALVVSYRTSSGSFTFSDKETPSGAIDDSNVTFTLAHTPTTGSEHVYLNGSLMAGGGADYTLSGGTITFTSPPAPGSVLLVSYRY